MSEILNLFKNIAGTSALQNDFSNIYYLANNLQRGQQMEAEIVRDMRAQGIKTIIPPKIMPYRMAFITIADNILNNRYNASEMTEYNEEEIRFFIYKLAIDVVKPVKGEAGYISANRRHNIVPDFDKFIAEVINHIKWDDAARLKPATGEPEAYFLEVLKKYMEAGQKHTGPRFFSALIAYKKLYDHLKAGKGKGGFDKILLIEDFDDMEPIFKEIIEMLIKAGGKVSKMCSNCKPETGNRKLQFYQFMSPLDEAEVVGFRIKQLLASGVPDNEIAVVPYNSKAADLIDLVFHRFGIRSCRVGTLASNQLFKLFKSAVYTAKYPEENAEELISVLDSEYSACRVTRETFKWVKKRLLKRGMLIHKKPLETVRQALEDTIKGSETYLAGDGKNADEQFKQSIMSDIAGIKKALTMALAQDAGISGILESVVDGSTKLNKDVLLMLSESAALMDETLAGIKDPSDYRFMLDALFSALSDREYFEMIDPQKEVRQYLNEFHAYQGGAFFIPVMDALSADNINAKHVFLFGLDASFDRQEVIRYPGVLAKGLKLP
ncbi:MAG TPA: hypothetical protein P5511_00950, partial [Candidatus Goldiibacteriota bacterium]|nr:hypothetical protein [Candidatus Goldiibacteriota bacterium]